MTVSSIKPVNNYAGNGSSTTFDFDFYIENEKQLVVYHTNKDDIQTKLIYGIDYSINEFKKENGSYITFPLQNSNYSILGENEEISLCLILEISQQKKYENSGDFRLETIESSLDYLTRICQILNRELERAIKVQEGVNIEKDQLLYNIDVAAKHIKAITAVNNNQNNINVCSKNIEDIKEATINAQVSDDKAKEAMMYADIAMNKADMAGIQANVAKIWAEGTDEDVIAIGGEHSAKVWSTEFYNRADVNLSNLSGEGEKILEAQKAYVTGNVLSDFEGYNQILEMFQSSTITGTDIVFLNGNNSQTLPVGEKEISYVLSKTGAKIVDVVYRDYILALYEEQGIAPYFTIDVINKTYTLPMGEVYGMIEKNREAIKVANETLADKADSTIVTMQLSGKQNAPVFNWTLVTLPYTTPAAGWLKVYATNPSGSENPLKLLAQDGTPIFELNGSSVGLFIPVNKGWVISAMGSGTVNYAYFIGG